MGSSNRKNQWQARILVHGKVTHLGYYETEEDAARVYDRVSISLHGEAAQTNFPAGEYQGQDSREYSGLDREDLQRALGVKPMDKSSKSAFLSCALLLYLTPTSPYPHSYPLLMLPPSLLTPVPVPGPPAAAATEGCVGNARHLCAHAHHQLMPVSACLCELAGMCLFAFQHNHTDPA